MSTFTPSIDFRGARGSNTGDQFHELWALQQVLDLLHPETDLKAVGVEGVRTETPSQNADDPTWDGVDYTLYYVGTTLETADQIEFVQLKYSAANPETAWSVARLTANTAKTTPLLNTIMVPTLSFATLLATDNWIIAAPPVLPAYQEFPVPAD